MSESLTRLPGFVVIGAMKAGTTTLYSDLESHPRIFLPDEKEQLGLTRDDVLGPSGPELYRRLYERAREDQLCGEASTAYSKLPDIPGVAERAREVLGESVKVLYQVREPVARVISQHYHELTHGSLEGSIDRAVQQVPRLIDYSRYAMQLEPWIAAFGADRVRVIRFESYIADRRRAAAAVHEFLGLEPRTEAIEEERIYNPSDGARAPRGPIWRLSQLPLYRRLVRPLLSGRLRTHLRRLTLPSAPPRPAPPSLETVDFILERVAEDSERLPRLAGFDQPLWDPEAVRARFAH